MTNPVNRLCLRAVDFRSAKEGDDDGRTLEGYAAVFNTPTEINSWEGKFSETIARGAFRKTIGERKPVLQFDHGHDARTGSVPIGAIQELREDKNGLFVKARLFDNPVVEPIRQAIDGGAISGMSFRFRVVRDEWHDKEGTRVKGSALEDLLYSPGERGPLKRTIREVELFEAGPVVFPAYPETSVGVRSLSQEERDELMEDLIKNIDHDSDHDAAELPVETDAARDGDVVDAEETQDPGDAVREEDTSTGHAEERATEATAPPVTPVPERKIPGAPKTRKESVPMNKADLTARMDEIRTRLAAINEEHRDAALPTETQTEWDGLEAEYTEAERSIASIEKRAESMKAFAPRERGSDVSVQSPAFIRSRDDIYDTESLRSEARNEGHYSELLRDNAMRATEKARFPGTVRKTEAQENIERLLDTVDNEQGDLAKRFLNTGSALYERAFAKSMKHMNTNALDRDELRAMALGSNAGADGGYAVPFQLDPSVILTNAGTINPLRQMARVEQIVGKEWQGVTSAGITVTREPEAEEADDNSPTLAQPTVKAERVQGFVPFSMEIDQDWNAFRSEVSRMLADAKEREEATSFVLGGGTPPAASGVVATLSGNTVGGTGAGTFAAADVYAVEEALAPRWRGQGQWLANKAIYNKIRQFGTTDGHALWERIGAGQPAELLGYKAHESSDMDGTLTASTGGDKILLFGDFSQFLIVDRVGMSVELVPHLFGTARNFPTGQRGIFAIWRNNSKILVHSAFKLLVTDNS